MVSLSRIIRVINQQKVCIPQTVITATQVPFSKIDKPFEDLESSYEIIRTRSTTPFLTFASNNITSQSRQYTSNAHKTFLLSPLQSPIQVVLGEYGFQPNLKANELEDFEHNPSLFFKEYLKMIVKDDKLDSLPTNSFILIGTPTNIESEYFPIEGNLIRLSGYTHTFGFATDEYGDPDIGTHIDYSKAQTDRLDIRGYVRPITGYNYLNGNYRTIFKDAQSIKSGLYIPHSLRAFEELEFCKKALKRSHKIKLAIIVLPGFDFDARRRLHNYLIDLIGADRFSQLHKTNEEIILKDKPYILGGGYESTHDGKLILDSDAQHYKPRDPSNCGEKIYYGLDYALGRERVFPKKPEKRPINFKGELFSAYPITAAVLAIERCYGRSVAKEVINILKTEKEFELNLKDSLEYRPIVESNNTPTPDI